MRIQIICLWIYHTLYTLHTLFIYIYVSQVCSMLARHRFLRWWAVATQRLDVEILWAVSWDWDMDDFVLQWFGCFRQVIKLWVRCNICHWRVEGWQIRNQQCRQIKRHREIENVNRAIAQYFGTCLFFSRPVRKPMMLFDVVVSVWSWPGGWAWTSGRGWVGNCMVRMFVTENQNHFEPSKTKPTLIDKSKKRTWQWQDKRTHTLTLQRNHVSTCPVRWCKFSGGNRLSPVCGTPKQLHEKHF